MKCNNCEKEVPDGKYCPECGFPVGNNKKPDSVRAMELLESISERVGKLEEAETAKQKRIEALAKKKAEENAEKELKPVTNAGNRKRGVLDFF
jgi:hypothetical protein